MFGYIRPSRGELKVKHYEYYKTAYCGLCNTLRRRHGPAARFTVNYDFTFLVVLLSALGQDPSFEYKRCPASPVTKKCAVCETAVFDLVADQCVILYYHKLMDSVSDEAFPNSLVARLSAAALRRAYKRARAALPEYDKTVVQKLSELSALEGSNSPSLDDTADCFASILSASVSHYEDDELRRPLELLLYHIGRFIYLTDARDDLAIDYKKGSYNPLIYRFNLTGGELTDADADYLTATAGHSINLAASAFSLLPLKTGMEIIENVIYLGLPEVWAQVESGVFNKSEMNRHKENRSNN